MERPILKEADPIDDNALGPQLRTLGLIRTLADCGYRRFDASYSTFVEALTAVLNATDAPPIDLHFEEALAELKGHRFFLVQQVLCDVIPHLNVDLCVLLGFVTRLIDAGGSDLAAGAPSTAFGEWTKKELTRPAKVYEAAREGDERALRLLSTTLQANADVEETLVFARANARETKLAAISALGAMELGERYLEVFDTLLQGATSGDEEIALRSLEAGYRAAAQRKSSVPDSFEDKLKRVLQTRSPAAVHLAANLLWLHHECLTETAIEECLAAVAEVDPDNVGTVSQIDHAAYRLLAGGRNDQVMRLLGQLIDSSKGRIALGTLQSAYYALQNAGSEVLGSAVVYWLLNGTVYTRKCIASEICSVGNDEPPFVIPRSSLPTDPREQLFLCRKAVGWFFTDPLAAVAIPLAVLDHGSREVAKDVLDLIFDPLLLSYGGRLRDYLDRYASERGASRSDIAELLARKSALQNAMEGVERLVELHPSETQREAERVQWHEQMERGMEQGKQRSFLDDLFAKQYILYGQSSLTPIYDDDGTARLSEIKMRSFSVSSELPLLDIVDPVGLDHTLFHLKLEPRGEP